MRTIGFYRYKQKRKEQRFTHPILIAVITALLACVGSISGVYLSAPILVSQFIEQKNHENRAKAYEAFLMSMSDDKYSASLKLIGLDQMVRNVTTDESTQRIEDNIELLSVENSSDKLFLHLIGNMQALKLHGSKTVDIYIDDFMSVLLGNEYLVNWSLHDEYTRGVRNDWINNDNPAYGLKEKVSVDERTKFIILSAQYVELVKLLKSELQTEDS
ncbi:MAG: hypothetical protein CMK63_10210 [Pseudoalteromonadaceae bacterium]|nr:hypothetical protein [Pseudoalteromonadaceae bacterium]|tara:strand:+ start:1242 stop:1889 length:648 start_codon:yes stop_codon:yes gene_type:complete